MGGTFTIDTDHQLKLLRVRMGGFFTLDDVTRYRAAVDAATAQLGSSVATQRMVCDITDMKIQSQAVVSAFAEGMANPAYRARPVGFIAASTLARSQLLRILGDRTARVFKSSAEAERWLLEAPAADAA